ncbi:MAG: HypC/HybG/HupF family hydrogenase formation chaperone [Candidatus Thermoplasmatota archaeon]|nr:HypC/HybG/HupF family hydrogenase formation chaperone [Candidatus Thermoplasmatota archaeon]
MCLAIPGKIIEINKKKELAVIDYGNGTKRKANISLLDVKLNDYVLVHAGFAIQKVDPKDAQETLEMFRAMMRQGDDP